MNLIILFDIMDLFFKIKIWDEMLCLQESFHFFKYKKSENILYEFADDVAPRHLISALPLDYDSVAGGDKFGNFFICRVPADVSAQVMQSYIQSLS